MSPTSQEPSSQESSFLESKHIWGIEELAQSGGNQLEDRESNLEPAVNYSLQEQAEQTWALWLDYRRELMEFLKTEREKRRDQVSETRRTLVDIRREFDQTPKVIRIRRAIAERWRNPQVQVFFRRHLAENIRAKEAISPELFKYRGMQQELKRLRREREEFMKNLFNHRDKGRDEIGEIELAELTFQIETAERKLGEIYQENPELAAHIQYETLRDYHQQFAEAGFIWLPSRRRLARKIEDQLINRGLLPIFLDGETGTGKTALVDALAVQLTGQESLKPQETSGRNIRLLIGTPGMMEAGDYIRYGPISRALTGKSNSLLTEREDEGGIAFIDEANSPEYPESAIRAIIKALRGRRPGQEITFDDWRGKREIIAPNAGLFLAGILPSKRMRETFSRRHPGRSDWPADIRRELSGNIIKIDYLEQTPENPEIYEAMLAVLMDDNGRIRLKKGELEPRWEEKIDVDTKERTLVLDTKPSAGGTLWRLSNLIADIQRSYQRQENALTPELGDESYLLETVLVAGDVLRWLRHYRDSENRYREPLKEFIQLRLNEYLESVACPEDVNLLRKFCELYGFPLGEALGENPDVEGEKNWSEEEIGFLSPRVPRPREEVTLELEEGVVVLNDGTELKYTITDVSEEVGVLEIDGVSYSVLGKAENGQFVLQSSENEVKLLTYEELLSWESRTKIEKILSYLQDEAEIREEIGELILSRLPLDEQKKFREYLEKEEWGQIRSLLRRVF